jgi:hypothetical protein
MGRPWQEIARELARETDRERIAELREELNRAIAEQKIITRCDSEYTGPKSKVH